MTYDQVHAEFLKALIALIDDGASTGLFIKDLIEIFEREVRLMRVAQSTAVDRYDHYPTGEAHNLARNLAELECLDEIRRHMADPRTLASVVRILRPGTQVQAHSEPAESLISENIGRIPEAPRHQSLPTLDGAGSPALVANPSWYDETGYHVVSGEGHTFEGGDGMHAAIWGLEEDGLGGNPPAN